MDDGTDNRVSEEDCTQEEEAFHDAPEFVSEVDNRYLSEDATVKEGKVELTEEQIKVTRQADSIAIFVLSCSMMCILLQELKTHAGLKKDRGNECFRNGGALSLE